MAGKALETYVFSNRVTLIGDAAHTHGGAFAAGGSLAIDDAYCFSLALNHVFPINANRKPDKKELAKAFKLLIAKQKEKVDISRTETDEGLRERIISRPDPAWISEHDVKAAFDRTVKLVGKIVLITRVIS
ncbi:hypothetical protein V491_06325 [Pseudogymnoascus sp. VKM F-3775]|nr:hypothetical protein V491_06325 [Pseudogymnoascus sp. VKM F-3775]